MSDQSEHGRTFPAVEDSAAVHLVEGLVIRPGDTFIVHVDRRFFGADGVAKKFVHDLQNELHYMLPDVCGVVFLIPGQIAVQRAPELDDPARPLVDLAPLPESVPLPSRGDRP